MTGLESGHAAYLATALATHALVGYTLGRVLLDRPWAGLVGGVVADVDLLVPQALGWPLAHRGITHTAVAALAAVGVATWLTRRRRVGLAVGLGYASQLAIDSATARGVALFYPLTQARILPIDGGHSAVATAVLWTICLGTLLLNRARTGRNGTVVAGVRR